MIILGPKTAILGPQFCRILVLGPHFWWSGVLGPWGPLDLPLCLYWRCKNHQSLKTRSAAHVTYTDPENSNMMHTREDAIRSDRGSELGLKTVGVQDPVSDIGRVVNVRLQHAFTKAVLNQLAANGTDVDKHRRKLRNSKML